MIKLFFLLGGIAIGIILAVAFLIWAVREINSKGGPFL